MRVWCGIDLDGDPLAHLLACSQCQEKAVSSLSQTEDAVPTVPGMAERDQELYERVERLECSMSRLLTGISAFRDSLENDLVGIPVTVPVTEQSVAEILDELMEPEPSPQVEKVEPLDDLDQALLKCLGSGKNWWTLDGLMQALPVMDPTFSAETHFSVGVRLARMIFSRFLDKNVSAGYPQFRLSMQLSLEGLPYPPQELVKFTSSSLLREVLTHWEETIPIGSKFGINTAPYKSKTVRGHAAALMEAMGYAIRLDHRTWKRVK